MQTSVSNGMSLLFNTLSRLVRGNRLIEWVWDGTQYRAFLANPSWCWRYCPEEAHLEEHWSSPSGWWKLLSCGPSCVAVYSPLLLCWAWFWLYLQSMRPVLKLSVRCPPEHCCLMGSAPARPRTQDARGKIEKTFHHGSYFVYFQSLYYWLQSYTAGRVTWCVRAAQSARSSGDLHLTQQCEGFPGGSRDKASACQCRRHKRDRFDPQVGKISWRRKWQFTPLFFPGKSHGSSSLMGYSPWGWQELDTTEPLSMHAMVRINATKF